MRRSLTSFVGALTLAAIPLGAQQIANAQDWLDRPPTNWTKPTQPLPRQAARDEPRDQIRSRGKLEDHQGTPAERALAEAGWIPSCISTDKSSNAIPIV